MDFKRQETVSRWLQKKMITHREAFHLLKNQTVCSPSLYIPKPETTPKNVQTGLNPNVLKSSENHQNSINGAASALNIQPYLAPTMVAPAALTGSNEINNGIPPKNNDGNNLNSDNDLRVIAEIKASMAKIEERVSKLERILKINHGPVVGTSNPNPSTLIFNIKKVRESLFVRLFFFVEGVKEINIAKLLRRVVKNTFTTVTGIEVVKYYTTEFYKELFGKDNLKHYSSTKAFLNHSDITEMGNSKYIRVSAALPKALVSLFCDGFEITKTEDALYFAKMIEETVNAVSDNIFNNARKVYQQRISAGKNSSMNGLNSASSSMKKRKNPTESSVSPKRPRENPLTTDCLAFEVASSQYELYSPRSSPLNVFTLFDDEN